MKYTVSMTCKCPEQYDVYNEKGEQVAFFNLDWGTFTVTCPDPNGKIVYCVEVLAGYLQFYDDKVRKRCFRRAFKQIDNYLKIKSIDAGEANADLEEFQDAVDNLKAAIRDTSFGQLIRRVIYSTLDMLEGLLERITLK